MEKKTYIGIDLFKLICAVLIVYMHTYCYDYGAVGQWLKDVISSIAVPFFFIASGYFYVIGLDKSENTKSYLKKYVMRIIKMYLIWTIITLPVAWYNIVKVHGDYTIVTKIIYLFRCIIFSGSVGIYWYLLALIYNSVIIYLFYVKFAKAGGVILLILSIPLFVIGILYEANTLPLKYLVLFIHTVFGSERNFWNVGLFYMAIGYLFANNITKIIVKMHKAIILLIIILSMETLIRHFIDLKFIKAFAAVVLFVIALQIDVKGYEHVSKELRKISTAIYLGHFPIILVFDFYLRNGTLLDFSVTLVFTLVLYFLAKILLPRQYFYLMYGN